MFVNACARGYVVRAFRSMVCFVNAYVRGYVVRAFRSMLIFVNAYVRGSVVRVFRSMLVFANAHVRGSVVRGFRNMVMLKMRMYAPFAQSLVRILQAPHVAGASVDRLHLWHGLASTSAARLARQADAR